MFHIRTEWVREPVEGVVGIIAFVDGSELWRTELYPANAEYQAKEGAETHLVERLRALFQG